MSGSTGYYQRGRITYSAPTKLTFNFIGRKLLTTMKLQLLKEPRDLKSWVDVPATITKFEYDPRWFKPSSERLVVTVCEGCKVQRDCKLRGAELHAMCSTCSNRRNAQGAESRQKRSEFMKRCNLFLSQLCMHPHKFTYSTATLRLSMIFISDKPPPD